MTSTYESLTVGARTIIAVITMVQRMVRKSKDGAVTGRLQKSLTSSGAVIMYS